MRRWRLSNLRSALTLRENWKPPLARRGWRTSAGRPIHDFDAWKWGSRTF